MDLGAFKKVELTLSSAGGGSRLQTPAVSLYRKHNYLALNREAIKQSGFQDGDRLDLYRMGRTFALKRATVGLLTVKAYRNSGTKSDKTQYRIANASACLEIRSATRLGDEESKQRNSYRFRAWVEEGVLFFRTDEEV